nr:MAG TPA: hypothetical protein [Caudoviricetes sp.]
MDLRETSKYQVPQAADRLCVLLCCTWAYQEFFFFFA